MALTDTTPERVYDAGGHLRRGLVLVMAVSTGCAVANLYYAQPLLPTIGRSLHLAPDITGLMVTIGQIGFASGLFFLLPLGDLIERRRLIVALCAASAGALVLLGSAANGAWLWAGALAVGVVSVLAQTLVPFAASLAAPDERGRVVGTVMSGLLIGILLARTVSGALAEGGSWRLVYFVAAAVMLADAAVLARVLPRQRGAATLAYRALLASTLRLVRDEPVLRWRCAYGFLGFAAFNVLWTSMAFLLARTYHESSAVIGLFGLVGAAGALAATAAGRLSDRRRERLATGVTTVLLGASWAAIAAGEHALWALVVGIVVLDVGQQGLHITNQGEIYRLDPAARSRLTAAYMMASFIGGGIGSATSATVYARAGWGGVSLVGAGFSLAAVAVFLAAGLATGRRARVADPVAERPT